MDVKPTRRVATIETQDTVPTPVREATARFSDHMDACGYCNETELDKHVKECACCIRLRQESNWRIKLCGFGEILGQWCLEGRFLELQLREAEQEHGTAAPDSLVRQEHAVSPLDG